jgi:hypothetical protein
LRVGAGLDGLPPEYVVAFGFTTSLALFLLGFDTRIKFPLTFSDCTTEL